MKCVMTPFAVLHAGSAAHPRCPRVLSKDAAVIQRCSSFNGTTKAKCDNRQESFKQVNVSKGFMAQFSWEMQRCVRGLKCIIQLNYTSVLLSKMKEG